MAELGIDALNDPDLDGLENMDFDEELTEEQLEAQLEAMAPDPAR